MGTLLVGIYNSLHIKRIHVIINSRMTQLLGKTDTASRAAGKAEGIAEQKATQRTKETHE